MGKLKVVEVTMQEIWAHTRPLLHKNKKKYTRKTKHKPKSKDDE